MKIEFHFDFGSPNAYLSHLAIPDIEKRLGIEFEYVPILLGGVFKLTNNAPPAETLSGIRNKVKYQEIETVRFLKKHKITKFKKNPFFPVNTLRLMRGAVSLLGKNNYSHYVDQIFAHMWAEPKKMDEEAIFRTALISSEIPADKILDDITQPEIKSRLLELTSKSVEKGTFGSPTFFLDEEIFFGKDKLIDLEDAIDRKIRGE